MIINKIETELGFLSGRDAIHLDKVTHNTDKLELIFEGQIVGSLCSVKQSKEWIKYKLTFEGVTSYKCTPLDDFNRKGYKSSFDTINFNDSSKLIDYVLSTYDYVYEVKGSKFELQTKKSEICQEQNQ